MELSIIVPACNVEQYLERCIASIQTQNLKDYEVIIINDGSKDNTLQIAQRLANTYKNIIVFSQDNKGLSATRNVGITKAQGEYIIFLDSDDFYNPNCLNYLLDEVKNNNLDVLQFGYSLNKTGVTKKVSLNEEVKKYSKKKFLEEVFFSPFAWNKIIKRCLLIDNNLFFAEGKLMEDDYFTTEMFLKADRIGNTDLEVYNYFHNPNSIRKTVNREHELKIIEDLVFSCNRHSELFEFANTLNLSKEATNNLIERRESIIFFMIFRMMKLGLTYDEIKSYLNRINFDRFHIFPKKFSVFHRGNISSKFRLIGYKILSICMTAGVLKLFCFIKNK